MVEDCLNASDERRFSLVPEIVIEQVADEYAITNSNGDIIVLNETAGMIVSLLDDELSVAEVALQVTLLYEVDYDRALEDAIALMSKLESAGIIAEAATEPENKHQDVSRRDLLYSLFSIPKGNGCGNASSATRSDRKAASIRSASAVRVWRDSLGRDIKVPLHPRKIAPCGPYAQALLESICPESIVWAGSRGVHGSAMAMSFPEAMRFERIDSAGTKRMDWLNSVDADLAIEVEQRLSLLSIADNVGDGGCGKPVVRIIAGFGGLGHAYRVLGSLLQRQRAFDLAQIVDSIDELLRLGRADLREGKHKRVFYGHGQCGLDTLGRGALLGKLMESVGAHNVAAELDRADCVGLTLQDVRRLEPELVILARCREDVVGMWKNWQDCPILYIPEKPYPWLTGNPLSMQTIGALWLAHAVHSDVFDYDMKQVAESCFRAFFNRPPSIDELSALN